MRGIKTFPARRDAFSLIELIIVILLMAVLAALASTSVRGAIVRRQLNRSFEVIERFDTELRRAARRDRREVAGWIERDRGVLMVRSSERAVREFRLPDNVRIESFMTDDAQSGGRIIAAANGSTPSYAVQISCGSIQRWVTVAGISGQVVSDQDRQSVEALLGAS